MHFLNSLIILACCAESWNDTIQSLATSVSAIVASLSLVVTIITVIIAYREYKKIRKKEKCDILTKYNERYTNDPSIRIVIDSYLDKKTEKRPTVNEKELFLRFFEELEVMIIEDYISEKHVHDFFSYYFLVLWDDDDFWNQAMIGTKTKLQAQNSNEWRLAKSLYTRMIYRYGTPDK